MWAAPAVAAPKVKSPSHKQIADSQVKVTKAADKVGQITAHLATVEDQIERSEAKTAQLMELYNKAIVDQEAAEAEAQRAETKLNSVKEKTANAKNAVDAMVVDAYMGTSTVMPISSILTSDNGSDMLHNAAVVSVMQDRQSQALDQLQNAQNAEAIALSKANNALSLKKSAVQTAQNAQSKASSELTALEDKYNSVQSLQSQLETELAKAELQTGMLVAQRTEAELQEESDRNISAAALKNQSNRVPVSRSANNSQSYTSVAGKITKKTSKKKTYIPEPSDIKGTSAVSAVAVSAAMTQIGRPYVWGAESPSVGFDCSGLVVWAYRQAGVSLPHYSVYLYQQNQKVNKNDLRPGDLVFYAYDVNGPSTSIHHVAIYLGDNKMLEAPRTGLNVRITTMRWTKFYGAARVA